MPENVEQPSTVSWDTEKFGFIGNAIRNGARDGLRNGQGMQESLHAGIRGAADSVGGAGGAGSYAAQVAMANVGSAFAGIMGGEVSASGLMGDVAGKIRNPYLTMVFRGVDFRNFSFVFKFFPFSRGDCDTILDIIKIFRKNALPTKQEGDAFFGYPAECDIAYMWNDSENKWLHKFKKAVCTAVDVNYTSSGMFSVMRNGFPSEITMSTKWSEIEVVTREDVEAGF